MNIRKIITMSLLSGMALGFAGCAGEEEDLFSSSAAERLDAAVKDYTEYFAANGGKWTVEYYPTNGDEAPQGLGYLMLWDFDSDNSVKVAMNNDFTGNVYKEDASVWEIIADNGPVLSFNTYNECLHAFSDPNDIPFTTGSLNDETGLGAEGDYEFIVLNLGKDAKEGMLKGKKRSVYDRIIRLPEDTDFPTYMADIKAFYKTMFPIEAPNYTQLNMGDEVFRIDTIGKGMPNIYRFGGNAVVNESYHPYLITKHDGKYRLRFREDFVSPASGITAREFVYDEESQLFTCVENPEYTITGANPNYFFGEWISESRKWQYTRNMSQSDDMKVLFDNIVSDLSALRYTFQNMQIVKSDEGVSFDFSFRSGIKVGTASFLFTIEYNNDGVSLVYVGPKDDSSANVLSHAPGVKALLDKFSGSCIVSASINKFNLGTVRLTLNGDENFWCNLTAIR